MINDKKTNDNIITKTGILLINIGTPEALDYFSMRKYLKQFLSDPRVVQGSRIKWWLVLNIILLSFIPFRSIKNYRKIWNYKNNESPLLTITRNQAEKLQQKFTDKNIIVDFAMNYSKPYIADQISKLQSSGCDKITILPLFPQYSRTTTASVEDVVAVALKKLPNPPVIKFAKPYYNHPAYIATLAGSVQNMLASVKSKPQLLLCSYHGIPQKYVNSGDPYQTHCIETTRLLQQELGSNIKLKTVFQSHFGRDEWIKPYFDEVLQTLPSEGVKNIAVISPAFASDCIETLEEIAVSGRAIFLQAGGEEFTYIPCLNDTDAGITMLNKLI